MEKLLRHQQSVRSSEGCCVDRLNSPHISSIHWIMCWPGVAVAVLALVAYWLGDTRILTGGTRHTLSLSLRWFY
jgi:hypothetical protein